MDFITFVRTTADNEKIVAFLIERAVLASSIQCSNCGGQMNIDKNTLLYRCRRRHAVKNAHKKKVMVQCDYKKSAKAGTWFDRSNLDVEKICNIVASFLRFPPPRQDLIMDMVKVAPTTIVDWSSFCREVCVFWAKGQSQKLGGPGCTVEIDEAKIGKRKYNRGRLVTGQWIFSGYERVSKKVFIVPVQDRTEDTLLKCIKEWILPGTIVISDCWKSYNCLNSEGFQHLTVNHSYNFVDPETGAHTQHIERVWREVRQNIPRYSRSSDHYEGYLAEFLFKRVHSRLERIEAFFDTIAVMYPPGTEGLSEEPEPSVEPCASTSAQSS